MKLVKFGLLLVFLLSASFSSLFAQRLIWFDGYTELISADSSTVVGRHDGGRRAFRWTPQTGIQDLGTLGGSSSQPLAVSRDGRVVVGFSNNRAFRWTPEGGIQDLGSLGNHGSSATAVSADGSTVIGESFAGQSYRAFRWTEENGMEDLGSLESGNTVATGISADGRLIVGYSGRKAFRWTPEQGMTELFPLRDHRSYYKDLRVSEDGNVIAGIVAIPRNKRPTDLVVREAAFYWTARTGLVEVDSSTYRYTSSLIALSGQGNALIAYLGSRNHYGTLYLDITGPNAPVAYVRHHSLRSISANGVSAVGSSFWLESGRRRHIGRHFEELSPGSYTWNLNSVSGDGRYIVGWGYNAAEGREMGFRFDRVREVPEPASFFILGSALTGYILCRRRNRVNRAA